MRFSAIVATTMLVSATATVAQDDPAAAQARANAQQAQLNVIKTQLDLENSLRGTLPNNPSSITSGEKSAEVQILKYITYRAVATKLVAAIGGNWRVDKATPLVIIGSSPPSFAALNAYRSDLETVRTSLRTALRQWIQAYSMRTTPSTKLMMVGPAAALGILTTGISMFAPSSTVTGASLSADNAQVATIVEQAIFDAGGKEDYAEFSLARGGGAAADRLLASLKNDYDDAKLAYEKDYLPNANTKTGNDAKDAALKAGGASLAAALGAYDALHAKLLSDNGSGVATAVAIQRLTHLENADYAKIPLLYILGNEASVSIETKKGLAHWFDSHPFEFRAVVTLNYLLISGSNASPQGTRGTVSCIVTASKYKVIAGLDADVGRAALCGQDVTLPLNHS